MPCLKARRARAATDEQASTAYCDSHVKHLEPDYALHVLPMVHLRRNTEYSTCTSMTRSRDHGWFLNIGGQGPPIVLLAALGRNSSLSRKEEDEPARGENRRRSLHL
ncbi:hypothetical protein RJ55_03108 [Drechmeria coniospora]|nr:hypothetical protein RJ55_03108 [Drechmeria coniospora]